MSPTTTALAARFLSLGGRFIIDPTGTPLFAIDAQAYSAARSPSFSISAPREWRGRPDVSPPSARLT